MSPFGGRTRRDDGLDGRLWFFGAGWNKRGNRVQRKQVAKIKHRRGVVIVTERGRERNRICKTERDHQREIVTSLVVAGT